MRQISFDKDNIEIINLFRKIDRFKELSDHDLNAFIASGKLRKYEPDEIIIKEGDYDCWVYFLISGELNIIKDDYPVGTLRRSGDIFGEIGVIDGSPRSATIRTKTNVLTLGIDASVIDQKLKSREMNFCYIVYRIFAEVLAIRLRNTTDECIALKKQLAEVNAADKGAKVLSCIQKSNP